MAISLTHCAQESAPQGGPKDEKPPQVRRMKPQNKSLYFNSKTIEITFDEFVKSPGFTQTLVSPPMDPAPKYSIRGKTLKVKLKDELRPNTTYTINFGDDVQDVNESNKAENLTYVFSTGDYIDSQEIGGKVIFAKDNSPAENIVVALYPPDSIDPILKNKPFYFAKTNKNGEYHISNIRFGEYQIYALKDQNFNYLYDQPNEQIGFLDSLVSIKDTLPSKADMILFEEEHKRIQLDRTRTLAPGWVQFAYIKPIEKFTLKSDITSPIDFWYFNKQKDTVNYWLSNYYTQKAELFPVANDTILDTVRIELKYIPKDSSLSKKEYVLSIGNQVVRSRKSEENKEDYNAQELFKPLRIDFSRPVVEINQLRALQITDDSIQKVITPKISLDSNSKMFALLEFEKQEDRRYTLHIPDSAFRDMYNTWNRETFYKFQTNTRSDYGNINLTLKSTGTGIYIFRLMKGEEEIVKEIPFTGDEEQKIKIENVAAGSYKAIVVDDRNRNGKWDNGDFKNKIQPEKIYTFPDSYQLKGGWDLDVEVKF